MEEEMYNFIVDNSELSHVELIVKRGRFRNDNFTRKLLTEFVQCYEILNKDILMERLNLNPSHLEGMNRFNYEYYTDVLLRDKPSKYKRRKLLEKQVLAPLRWVHISELTENERMYL